MTSLGTASLDFQVLTAPALASLRTFATSATAQFRAASAGAKITPSIDSAAALRDATKLARQIQDKLKVTIKLEPVKAAAVTAATKSVTGSVKVSVAVAPLTQKALDTALKSVPGEKKVRLTLDDAAITGKISGIRSQLTSLAASLTSLFKIDASDLKTVSSVIGKQIADLTALESRLRALLASGGSGGGRSGTGGGSPGTSGLSDYARQLKAIQGDLKSGAASTAQFEASTRAVKTAIDAEIASLRGLGVLTTDQSRRLDSLRSSAGQAEAALKGVATNATQQAAKAQSEAVSQLGRELSLANSKFQQGTLSTRDYLREMQRIQAAATALQPSLQAGSRDAQNLARTLQGIGGAGAKINATSITNVRTELARARTDYEKAISAAGSSWRKQQDAASQYQKVLAQVDAKITQIGRRPTVTPQQTQALANLQRQMASQQNALQGSVSPLGLSGSVLNALRQIPGLAQAAGGSLGAAAGQAGQLAGGLGGVAAAIGPIGIAIGVAVLALGSFISLAGKSLSAFTDFEDAIQNAKGTLGLFGQEGRAAGEQLSKLAQSPALTKLGFDSVQAAKAIEELGSRGLDTSEILGGGLETAAKLAAASGVKDLNVAAEALVGTMKAFGIEGEEAKKIPDLLANAANVSALKLEDFRLAIAAGGSAARTAGFSVNEFTTTISLMRDRLISASDAGTSFKAFTAALTPNSKDAAAAMKQIGFSAFDASGKMKSQRAIVEQLSRGLRGMTDEQRQLTLETIFGSDGVRTATTLLDAYNGKTKDGTRLIDVRTAALNQQGTADKAAAERTNSLKQAQVQLSNQVLILKQRLGEQLAPAALAAVKGATALLDSSRNLGAGLKTLTGYLIPAGVALLAFRANMIATATTTAWASLQAVLVALPGLITALGLSIRTFIASNPIGLIATVAAGIAVYAKQIIDDTQSIYDAIDQNEQSSFDGLMKRVRELTKAGDELSKAKARFLLAQSSLSSAQAGNVTGTNFFTGERIIKIDPAEVKAAQQRLDATTKELKAAQLRATTRATGTVDTTTAASTAAAIKAATDAAGKAVISAVASDTGNQAADKIVDNCLKWVRLQLDKANPAAAAYINKLFQSGGEKFTDKNGKTSIQPTARTAAKNLDNANLLRTFSSAKDLTVGDSVFYTSNGQNHSGIYLGKINGVDTVRGNNRVTAKQTGGARVVGDVPLSDLGKPDSYVKSSELFAAAGKPVGGPAVSAIKTANAEMQKQIDIGKHLQAQLQAALAAGNDVWAAKIRGSIKVFKKENADAWAQISSNATTGGQTTGIALTKLKAALKDANPERLAELKLLYDQTKNTAAYNAVVTEQARRTREASASHDTAGIALTKLKAALKGASDSRLVDLKTEYDQTKNATAYNAVVAEQARRTREVTASHNTAGIALTKLKAALKGASASRLADLKTEYDQTKNATAYNAVVAEQARRTREASASHNTAGIALSKLKVALKGASDSRLADLKTEYDQAKNTTAYSAVVAEQTKRLTVSAAATKKAAAETKKHEAAATALGTRLQNLNEDFSSQTDQGKVTVDTLREYQQALKKARTDAQGLPPALRDNVTSLISQGDALAKTGKAAVDSATQQKAYAARLKELKGEVDKLTLSELQNYRVKLVASGADQTKLDVLDKQIEKLQQAQAAGEQLLADSQASTQKAATDSVIARYEQRKQAAGQNLAQLLQIEKDFGAGVLAEKNRQARVDADADKLRVGGQFDAQISANQKNTALATKLKAERKAALTAIDTAYDNAALSNQTGSNQARQDAQTRFDQALLTQSRSSRKLLLQQAVQAAGDSTLEVERQQAEELSAENVTAQQKLGILKKFQPQLEQAKRGEITAQRQAQLDEEAATFADALKDATDQGADLEVVKKDHLARLTAIDRQYGDGAAQEGKDLGAYLLGLRKETNAAQTVVQRQQDQALLALDRETRKLLLAERLRTAAENTTQLEGERAEALNAEDLTAAARLDALKKYQPLLVQAKRDEIAAQRKALVDEEDVTYADAKKAAEEQGSGLELVNAGHTARMAAIDRQYGDGVKTEGKDLSTYLLSLDKETNAAQTTLNRQQSQAELTLDRQSRKLQLAEALRAAADQTTVLENRQRNDLDAEELTAGQRLAIIQRNKPLLEQAKRAEIAAQRKALTDEEANIYKDAINEATKQGYGLEVVNADHVTRMAAIDRQYGDGVEAQGQDLIDYLAGLQRDLLKARASATKETLGDNKEAAQQLIDDALTGLDGLQGAQRESLRLMLIGMRDFYAFLGPVGADAVKQLDKAIGQVEEVGRKARVAAGSLVVDPTKLSADFGVKLAKIGAPEIADDAKDKATVQFAEIRSSYTDGIDEINLKLKEFEGKPLTLDEAATKLGLEATLRLYTGFVGQVDDKAKEAGDRAATAFTTAATDAAEQAKVELAKAQRESGLITDAGYQQALSDYAVYMHKRVETFAKGTKERSEAEIEAFKADQAASQNQFKKSDAQATAALALAKKRGDEVTKDGGNGAAVYKAGLEVARKYWEGRLAGLKGTDEQTNAEREAVQQTIEELGQSIENLIYESPLTNALDKAAEQVGKGGKLQSVVSGGLDGLSEYFKSGGGVKGVLAGAAAFVGGLKDVFATGNEDVDNVTNAFVDGVQGTLGALAKGDWIGAIVAAVATVINTVLNIIQGAKRSLAKAKQEISDSTKDIKFFDLGKYAVVETYRGGFLGLQTLSRSKIDQVAVDIAKTLGDAIYSGISNGILNGVKSGKTKFSMLGIDLKKDLSEQIIQGLIDGFLRGAVIQQAIQPFLDAYVAAMKSGDANALAAAAEGIQNAAVTANQQLQSFYENVIVPTSQRLGVFGSDNGPAGSLTAANAQLSELQSQYQNAKTQQERDQLKAQIDKLQVQIKAMSGEVADLSSGATSIDTNTVTIKGGESITSSIDFDVLGTLSSAVSTYVPVFATAVGDFRGAVGELVAMVDSRSRQDSQYASYRGNRGNLA